MVPIRLPPLRERTEDIPALARHFLEQAAAEGLPLKSLDRGAVDRLKQHRWPGNVRELENLVRRLAALYAQEVVGVDACGGRTGRRRAGRRRLGTSRRARGWAPAGGAPI